MPRPDLHFLVCTNDRGEGAERPCCARSAALETYRRLKDAVRAAGLRETVLATRTGCLRRCSHGPTVVVWPANRWYARVSADDVEDLLDAERAGRELERLRMPEGPWE
ncbi:MAG: (2Fe-2S) ferredoxin domain-containing protein [Acidobacteria bacterium]|nr:(2Fe-2S) ferredoxin domain-containing protein [Acidobacteriota bacterium]